MQPTNCQRRVTQRVLHVKFSLKRGVNHEAYDTWQQLSGEKGSVLGLEEAYFLC